MMYLLFNWSNWMASRPGVFRLTTYVVNGNTVVTEMTQRWFVR